MFKQIVMHLPEFVLSRGSLGCFRCMLSMGMYLIKRKVSKCNLYFITKPPHDLPDDMISHASRWTFIITILYYHDRCINRTPYVINSNIYRSSQFLSFIFQRFFILYFDSPPFTLVANNST